MKLPNEYDQFAEKRAQEFASGKNLVHAYIEKPAMYTLLPGLENKSVLCVGCGTGEECIELKNRGAHVTGVDVSSVSIDYASEHISGVDFKCLDMDSPKDILALGEDSFDLIYSSLTLHYSNNLDLLFKNLGKLLTPHGLLLFSVGHPLRWAAKVEQKDDTKSVIIGYSQRASGIEIFGDYLSTKQFTQKLSDGPEVTYWMRPISSYFELLKDNGYNLLEFKEPSPVATAQQVDQNFWNLRTKIPVDMIFLAQTQS